MFAFLFLVFFCSVIISNKEKKIYIINETFFTIFFQTIKQFIHVKISLISIFIKYSIKYYIMELR
jgi:hypothetical protein